MKLCIEKFTNNNIIEIGEEKEIELQKKFIEILEKTDSSTDSD